MKEEFRQQEDNIKKLEEQVQDYKTKGKSQAANRLEYQIQLLKVGYYSIWALTRQSLSGFRTK